MRRLVILLAVLAAALAAPPPARAQAAALGQPEVVGAVLTAVEKHTIRGYFSDSARQGVIAPEAEPGPAKDRGGRAGPAGMPPAPPRPAGLPPGLAKHQPLPAGLSGRGLPPELIRLLPPRPPGQKVVIIGSHVVLLEGSGNLVLDILPNAIGR